jgi:hypothetical protein
MRLFKRWAAMFCQVCRHPARGVVLVLVAMRGYVGLSAVRHNKVDRGIDQSCVGTYTEPSPATILDAGA